MRQSPPNHAACLVAAALDTTPIPSTVRFADVDFTAVQRVPTGLPPPFSTQTQPVTTLDDASSIGANAAHSGVESDDGGYENTYHLSDCNDSDFENACEEETRQLNLHVKEDQCWQHGQESRWESNGNNTKNGSCLFPNARKFAGIISDRSSYRNMDDRYRPRDSSPSSDHDQGQGRCYQNHHRWDSSFDQLTNHDQHRGDCDSNERHQDNGYYDDRNTNERQDASHRGFASNQHHAYDDSPHPSDQ